MATNGAIVIEPRENYEFSKGLRATVLKKCYTHSAAHAKHSMEHDIRTAALERGSAWHTLVLEPELMEQRYIVATPPINPTTGKPYGVGTQKYDAWKDLQDAGKEIISSEEVAKLGVAASVIRQHPVVSHLLSNSKKEVSLYWTEDFGPCKARIDILTADGILADLKSTRDAQLQTFSREVFRRNRMYWIQAAWYYRGATQCGLDIKEFIFVATELFAPYGLSLHYFEPDQLEEMFHVIYPYAERFAVEESTGSFSGYPPIKSMLSLPDYLSAGGDDNGE